MWFHYPPAPYVAPLSNISPSLQHQKTSAHTNQKNARGQAATGCVIWFSTTWPNRIQLDLLKKKLGWKGEVSYPVKS